ncbi:hypothetical protein [Sodalis sp. dw_96]|uniref:hypothetical protein n=1 Tax=Sodalis sp. dw_96 TaxID=2719794 RepID=UPI001BD496DF|nr:hypothetical protein [Sodalis sp. dw_96]
MNIARLMTCYYTEPAENNERLGLLNSPKADAWRSWEKQAAHGSGELRQIAVSLVEECWDNDDKHLSLASLKLTSLPPYLPDVLETLDIHDNNLKSLPNDLPPLLTILDIHDNNLESLPNDLPSRLRKLDVCHNRLKKIPAWKLTELRELNAADNQLHRLTKHLPDSLRILNVQNNRLKCLPNNPPSSLCTLRINNNLLNELPATWASLRADVLSPVASPAVSAAHRHEPGEHSGKTAASSSAVSPDAASDNSRRKRSRRGWSLTLGAGCAPDYFRIFYRKI